MAMNPYEKAFKKLGQHCRKMSKEKQAEERSIKAGKGIHKADTEAVRQND